MSAPSPGQASRPGPTFPGPSARGRDGSEQTGPRLRVDWPACQAHGLCAELMPELIHVDEWGYPVVASGPVPEALVAQARRAVSSCPTLALRLQNSR